MKRVLLAASVLCIAALVAGSQFASLSGRVAFGAPGGWATYHHDAARSGIDPDQAAFSSVTAAWPAATVDGKIYAEPLVVGNQVIVATQNNSVYSFDVNTGALNW